MQDKLKNSEKAKGIPNRRKQYVIAGGISLLLLVIGVGLFINFVNRPVADIAYLDRCGIRFYDIDTETTTQTIPPDCHTYIHNFDISPDGQQVVYTNNEAELILADVNPYREVQRFDTLVDVGAVAWSPDGTTLAVWVNEPDMPTGMRLTFIDLETGDITQHGAYSLRYNSLSWSPNGEELIFSIDMRTNTQLVHYDVNTQTVTPLTDNDDSNNSPVWSDDGETVIFTHIDSEMIRVTLRLLDVQSGEMEEIAVVGATDTQPAMSSDGRYLTYIATSDSMPALFLRYLETGETTQLMPHSPESFDNVWLPNADYDG